MKTSDVGGKVSLLILVLIQLADCSGAYDDANIEPQGTGNQRSVTFLKPSPRSCAIACALNVDCVSFSYDVLTRACLLRDIIPWKTDMVYAKCKCQGDKCSLGRGFRCQVFQRHHPSSEPRVCGKQPDVMGARRHVSNGITTYMCEDQDFRICLKKTIRVQQCRWENWTGMCGRFRWRNPKTYYPLFLPCGSWAEFSVTIRGTPDNDSRFDVFVNKGQDSVFYADFRFKFKDVGHRIVCNTFIENVWGIEHTSMNHTLHIGQECIVKITLRHGVYRLDLDGERRCTVRERRWRVEPEFIVIEHGVTVHSVEIAV